MKLVEGTDRMTLKIIPSEIPEVSIRCEGQWYNFNLTWQKVTVNHGYIFYEVSIHINDEAGRSFAMVS